MRCPARYVVLGAVVTLALLGGCRPREPKSPKVSPVPDRSTAADAAIEHAATPAEREALIREREHIDSEARRTIEEQDREIQRLRSENEALARQIASRR